MEKEIEVAFYYIDDRFKCHKQDRIKAATEYLFFGVIMSLQYYDWSKSQESTQIRMF